MKNHDPFDVAYHIGRAAAVKAVAEAVRAGMEYREISEPEFTADVLAALHDIFAAESVEDDERRQKERDSQ